MFTRQHKQSLGRTWGSWGFILVVASGGPNAVAAADAFFVGTLAVAAEKEVADQLGLTEEIRARLGQLVSEREREGWKMARSIQDLPAAEQATRLLPFVAESERLGLELLTVAQREKLQRIRLGREGLAAVAEPGLGNALSLSPEQQAAVRKLLEQRAADLAKGSDNERQVTRAIYEHKLAMLFNDAQRAAWERLAGRSPATTADSPVATAAEPPPSPATLAPLEMAPGGQAASNAPPQVTPPGASEKPATEPPATVAATPAPNATAVGEKPATEPPSAKEPPAASPPTPAPAPSTKPAVARNTADTAAVPGAPPASAGPSASPDTPPAAPDAPPAKLERPQAMPAAPVAPPPAARGDAPETPPPAVSAADGALRFNFAAAPWKEVLEWLAQQSGLSLQIETLPVGSFTYRDDREFTVEEALDLLNSCLLPKGYTLVRRERILMAIDLESPVPEELVTLVTTEQLPERGRFELVKCLFPLAKMKPEDVVAMIKDFLGPQGRAIPFPKTRQILVTETAGKLRIIRDMIARAEDPESGRAETVVEISLKHASAEEVLSIARPLLGLAETKNIGNDISLSVDLLGTRIFASGNADKLQLLRDLVQRIDSPAIEGNEKAKTPEQLKLGTYYIKAADPQLVLRVVQTILADLPGVRVEVDAASGKLVALARPAEHRTIEETIRHLEGQDQQFEIIPLKRTDPQLAVLAINKFFGLSSPTADPKKEASKTTGPIVDGDSAGMKLWVRGTALQIEQVRDLVQKLEGHDPQPGAGGSLRTIPLTGASASAALEAVGQLWNRKNKVRLVTPSALAPSIKIRVVTPPDQNGPSPAEPSSPPSFQTPPSGPASKSAAGPPAGSAIRFASQPLSGEEAKPATPPAAAPPAPAASIDGAEIRVAVTPQGIVIMSEDTHALDEFERLLRSVTGPAAGPEQRELTVFYLRYAKADVAHKLVTEILTGREEDSGNSLLGDRFSGAGGGLLGGSVSTFQATGSVMLVPDPRLNAIIAEANPADLAFIEQVLRVIDRESSDTEVETAGVPRLIPIVHSTAEEVAAVVRQVFSDRIATATAPGGQPPAATPEDLMRAMRGQRGGSRRDERSTRGEETKMMLGVDQRSNALVVTAPEPLFRQVEALVKQIDRPGSVDMDVMSVVPIKVSDPVRLQKTLSSLMTRTQRTTGTTATPSAPGTAVGSPFGGMGFPGMQGFGRGMGGFPQFQGPGGGGGPPTGGGPPGGFGQSGGRRSFGSGRSGTGGTGSGGRSFGRGGG
jgi:type II secretory pathway component GspD/PulD (secretin)